MPFPDHFAFTRSERRAIFVLLAVILVLALIATIGKKKVEEPPPQPSIAQTAPTPTSTPEPTTPFAFNPNTADSATLRAVGFSPFVSSNIVKYRRAGVTCRRRPLAAA